MNILKGIIIVAILAIAFSCKKDGNVPVITLLGKSPVETGWGYPYQDAGATATDKEDGDLTAKIVITNSVDSSLVGTYFVKYNVTDSDGNKAKEVTREVTVSYFRK
jgi:hypothetical protein